MTDEHLGEIFAEDIALNAPSAVRFDKNWSTTTTVHSSSSSQVPKHDQKQFGPKNESIRIQELHTLFVFAINYPIK